MRFSSISGLCIQLNHLVLNVYPRKFDPLQPISLIAQTSHVSIVDRKQRPPQRTVGTIGSVWQESTPSKENTGPAEDYENDQSEMALA